MRRDIGSLFFSVFSRQLLKAEEMNSKDYKTSVLSAWNLGLERCMQTKQNSEVSQTFYLFVLGCTEYGPRHRVKETMINLDKIGSC